MNNMNEQKDNKVRILLTQDEAMQFYEVLCALPFRTPTSYDNEPPTEREEPIESVIKQLNTQVHWDD